MRIDHHFFRTLTILIVVLLLTGCATGGNSPQTGRTPRMPTPSATISILMPTTKNTKSAEVPTASLLPQQDTATPRAIGTSVQPYTQIMTDAAIIDNINNFYNNKLDYRGPQDQYMFRDNQNKVLEPGYFSINLTDIKQNQSIGLETAYMVAVLLGIKQDDERQYLILGVKSPKTGEKLAFAAYTGYLDAQAFPMKTYTTVVGIRGDTPTIAYLSTDSDFQPKVNQSGVALQLFPSVGKEVVVWLNLRSVNGSGVAKAWITTDEDQKEQVLMGLPPGTDPTYCGTMNAAECGYMWKALSGTDDLLKWIKNGQALGAPAQKYIFQAGDTDFQKLYQLREMVFIHQIEFAEVFSTVK